VTTTADKEFHKMQQLRYRERFGPGMEGFEGAFTCGYSDVWEDAMNWVAQNSVARECASITNLKE